MTREPWEDWEHEIQQRWGLDSTICSGNKFHDPGDAVDHTNPHDNSFSLIVDCKFTEKNSYSLNRKQLRNWIQDGIETGKRGVMAIRFWYDPPGIPLANPLDVVVMAMHDFEELREKARRYDEGQKPMKQGPMIDRTWGD